MACSSMLSYMDAQKPTKEASLTVSPRLSGMDSMDLGAGAGAVAVEILWSGDIQVDMVTVGIPQTRRP